MTSLSTDDLIDAAAMVEENYQIDMNKDIIFREDLNAYFNYSFDEDKELITFAIEVDEGGAEFFINDFFDEYDRFSITCNSVAKKYLKRINLDPIEGIPTY